MFPFRSLHALQSALRSGQTSCRAVVEYHLSRIEQTRDLNAFIEVWGAEALAKADELDRRLGSGDAQQGRLFGAVVSLKDNICYAGHRATAGSRILDGFESLYSATAVERLLAEDAILIGRTNCDEFGMGSSNENSAYGPVRNAADPGRVSGGSSGGAAVSVQTDCCLFALGSDTGGSVRQPAGFCGIWGFKPTYGRISRHGLIAYGSSFDQIGVLAHNADDIAVCLEVMAGPDAFDATCLPATQPTAANTGKRPARIAYFPEATDSEGLEDGVRTLTRVFMQKLRDEGHHVAPVTFDLLDYLIPAYYVLTTAEASSNLARFDGIRYGYRSPNADNFEATYLKSRTEGFGAEVKRRILLGTFVLSSGYYDAYYGKAQQARRLIRDRIMAIFREFDFILMPVAPDVAWRFGEKAGDPVAAYLSDIYTVPANLAGVPALAMPIGTHPDNGLPVGIQFMASQGSDEALLDFAGKLK
ncbi:MAG: Asp-tRNA(Asn)/Glu-tRNA(Gln) amidotransferase subunit GatA [Saprospiraceae bacterium]